MKNMALFLNFLIKTKKHYGSLHLFSFSSSYCFILSNRTTKSSLFIKEIPQMSSSL